MSLSCGGTRSEERHLIPSSFELATEHKGEGECARPSGSTLGKGPRLLRRDQETQCSPPPTSGK